MLLKLPHIDGNKKKDRKKKSKPECDINSVSLNIDSKIFKNGRTWLEVDRVTKMCPQNRNYFLQGEYKPYLGRTKLYKEEALPPIIDEKNDVKRYLYRELNPEFRNFVDVEKIRQKEEFLKKQWEDLEIEELKLKSVVEEHDKFIRHNVDKRITSQKKCGFYRHKNIEMKAKIVRIEKKIEYIKGINDKLNKEIRKNILYETFLDRAAHIEGYSNATQLIMRYLSIKEAEEVARKKNNEWENRMITHMCRLNAYRQEKLDMIEWLASKCSQQKENYIAVQAFVSERLVLLSAVQEETLNRLRKIVEAFNSVENFYNLVRLRHLDHVYIPLKEYHRQIRYIDASMHCIENINTKNAVQEEKQSSVEESIEPVYLLSIPRDEEHKGSSKMRLEEVRMSIIQKWAKLEQEKEKELTQLRRRTTFMDSQSDFRNLMLGTKPLGMAKLAKSVQKYTKYLKLWYSDDPKHTVTRNISRKFGVPSAQKKYRDKHYLYKTTSVSKTGDKIFMRRRKSSSTFRKSIQSSENNLLFPNVRKRSSLNKTQSKIKAAFKPHNNAMFFVSDDETVTIYSDGSY